MGNIHRPFVKNVVGHLRDINSVAISSDGQILASGSEDRTVKLWQLAEAAEQPQSFPARNLSGRSGMIKSVAISADGHFVASGGLDNNIHIWNLANGEVFNTLSSHFNSVNSVAISPDGKILASGSKEIRRLSCGQWLPAQQHRYAPSPVMPAW